jgi:hypothetical protein
MRYEQMDKLGPCGVCKYSVYWFSGVEWQCLDCVPCVIDTPIIFELRSTKFVRHRVNAAEREKKSEVAAKTRSEAFEKHAPTHLRFGLVHRSFLHKDSQR